MSVRDARKSHCHGVVVVRTAVKNVSSADIGQTHNGIICSGLRIISIGNRLRKAVEVSAVEDDAAPAAKTCRASDDQRLGRPIRIGGSGGRIDFDIAAAVGVQDLSGWKNEHPPVPGGVVLRVRCRRDRFRFVPSHSKKTVPLRNMPGLALTSTLPSGSSAAGPSATSSPSGKSGPGVHVPVIGVVNRGVACASAVGARRKHGAIGPQHRGTYLKGAMGIPELHNRAPGARP